MPRANAYPHPITTPIPSWPEAKIRQDPLPLQALTSPHVLVERRVTDLRNSRNDELLYLPGPPVISLFTGAGGFDLGMEAAGWCTVVQHEREPVACSTLIANRPNYFRHAALIQGDIRQTPTSMLLREGHLRVGEAHCLIGGPPCQGFSTINAHARKGKHDTRNDLVFEYLRVVREAQPQFFLFENVSGFTTFNQGDYLRTFLNAAYNQYYELVYGLIDAVEYGVPQYRCRFICAGTRRDLVDCDNMLASLPTPQHFCQTDLDRIHLVDTPLFQSEYQRITHAPGIRYFPDRPVLIPPAPIVHRSNHNPRRSKTYLDFYDRLERHEPDRIVRQPRVQSE